MEKRYNEDEYLLSLIDEGEALVKGDWAREKEESFSYELKDKEQNDSSNLQTFSKANEEERCYECPLYKNRNIYASPLYGKKVKILFIAPYPMGETILDKESYLMWVNWVKALGLTLDDVGLTTLLKCPTKKFDPVYSDICKKYLRKELNEKKPEVIVLLGLQISSYMLKNSSSYQDLRLRKFSINNIPTFVTLAPAFVVKKVEWKKSVWSDLKNVASFLNLEGFVVR